MKMKHWTLALVCLVPLLACGPVPVAQAERTCLERARLAQQPRGTITVGGTSEGKLAGGLELTVSSDYLTGRDPSEVFNSCVKAQSGEFPTRPLYDQPGWVR
jgi:hypothetical protein